MSIGSCGDSRGGYCHFFHIFFCFHFFHFHSVSRSLSLFLLHSFSLWTFVCFLLFSTFIAIAIAVVIVDVDDAVVVVRSFYSLCVSFSQRFPRFVSVERNDDSNNNENAGTGRLEQHTVSTFFVSLFFCTIFFSSVVSIPFSSFSVWY